MTGIQMRDLINGAFATSWPTLSGGVPFAFENEASTIPPAGAEFFALLTITPTTSQQRTTGKRGTRKVLRNGWIQVKLWGPVDKGAAGLAVLGDAAQAILEMVSLPSPVSGDDPVTTQAGMAGGAQGSTDGRWYMSLQRYPFTWWETK